MATSTDTRVKDMIFNVLDSNLYNQLNSNSQINNNELYFITDEGNQPLTVKFDGGDTENTNKFTYNGLDSKTINIAGGTNKFTVTLPNNTTYDVAINPQIANNITGTGTSGYLAKFNGTTTITNGPQLGSSTTTYLRNNGTWGTPPNTTYTFAEGSTNGAFTVTPSGGTAQTVNIHGLGNAAYTNLISTYSPNDNTQPITGAGVKSAIDSIPTPMRFKGSVGTGGTVSTLPAAAESTGFVYKVITTGSYSGISAQAGDVFISNGTSWVLIPSGDEPSGTVTSIAFTGNSAISIGGSPITSSGTISIAHVGNGGQNSVSNTGRTYIQSLTIDTYGHVTGISSATETVTDTTYTFNTTAQTNKIQYKKTGASSWTDVPINISIEDNITGVGVANTIAKFSENNTLTNGPAFGSSTTTFLRNDGQWTVAYTHPAYSTATAAAVKIGRDATGHVTIGNAITAADVGAATAGHTHSISIAASSETNQLTLAHGTKYAIVAGGNSFVFTMPTIAQISGTTQSATTGISISDHSTTDIYQITGVGTASTWSFTDITVPIRADSDTTVPTAATSATACDDITAWSAGSGSFTSGAFNGGSGSASLTFEMDTTDTKQLNITFSHTHVAATHGADSHTHTAPSLSYTARSITGVSGSVTVRGVKTGTSSTTTASKASGANSTVPTRASVTVVNGKTHTITDNGHTHGISITP